MRYRAIADSLRLVTEDGTTKYEFRNGVLDLGAGVTITPDFAGTNPSSVMQELYSTGTDVEKAGQGETRLFIEAPFITDAGTLAAAAQWYILDSGEADLTDAAFVGKYEMIVPINAFDLEHVGPGAVIKVTADITVPAQGAKWSRCFAPGHRQHDQDHDLRGEHFVQNFLTTHKDESSWNPAEFGALTKDPKYTRG